MEIALKKMANTLNFDLVSPEALMLSGQASAVVVPGGEGYSLLWQTMRRLCLPLSRVLWQ